MSAYYIEQDGKLVPADLLTWAQWLEDHADDERIVAQDQVTEDVRVSTIFIGLNYARRAGELHVYETMVFAPDGFDLAYERQRYASRSAAAAGHADMLARVRAALGSARG